MADFNPRAKSFIHGLSDLWTRYFKEVDILDSYYKGAEINIGQAYLDLLSLVLNSSVQDTTIFNKELFKLLTFREDQLRFKQITSSESYYQYLLPDNVVDAPFLNNKIFESTASLDRDVDYLVGDTGVDYRLDFLVDPTNAYYAQTFGGGISEFTLRSQLPGEIGGQIEIYLNDTGAILDITRSNYQITVVYDGPANTATVSTLDIIQEINTREDLSALLRAEVSGLATGTGSPAGTAGYTALAPVDKSLLDGFASRTLEASFGSALTDANVTNWIDEGVRKGDILRIIDGAGVGEPQEFDIALVRLLTLYTDTTTPIPETGSGKVNYAVIREPENNTSLGELLSPSGAIAVTLAAGVVVGAARTFEDAGASFSEVHVDDIVELTSGLNIGTYRILSVISPTKVLLAATGLSDEVGVSWRLRSIIDNANFDFVGTLTRITGTNTATFGSAGVTFARDASVGTFVRIYRNSVFEDYPIIQYTAGTPTSTTVVIQIDATTQDATASLTWGWASVIPAETILIFSPPLAWPKPNTLAVSARRAIDNQVVVEGIDYLTEIDTGSIRPLSVWRTSVVNNITYDYRLGVVENITSLQDGTDGTITSGSPNTISSPTAVFTDAHVGSAIKISGSGLTGATNDGIHYIASVTSPTLVTLTTDKIVPSTVDPNNGSLIWALHRRGTTVVEDVTAFVGEISAWAPDVLLDRFHLYNTYGYLINKYDRSSEEYRSFIRGLFQLFMLGPTLERFESAINTVAGMDVIRDDDEILTSYDSGAIQSGSDGFLTSSRHFTSVTAVFTSTHVGKAIFIIDGANVGRLFTVESLVSSTEVILVEIPTTDGPINWELTLTAEQTVTTSEQTYTFSRQIPLRSTVTDPANFGIKVFRAFEVLTEVFEVTDDVETPQWWRYAQIPEELLTNADAARRTSTPALFRNIVDPLDAGVVGDPGFIVGADSEGFIPTSQTTGITASDGVLTGDAHYPHSNTVRFSSAATTFTDDEIGHWVVLTSPPAGLAQTDFLITNRLSANQLEIQSFVELPLSTSALDFEIHSRPLPMRNKMAFVVLERFLKHHLFYVRFDSILLDILGPTILTDLQAFVIINKPTYTYVLVTPSALFQENITVEEEEFSIYGTHNLGGGAGDLIVGNENPLLVIGSSWQIGGWFRNVNNSSNFATPTASVTNILGVPDANFEHTANMVALPTPTQFIDTDGNIIQVADLFWMNIDDGTGGIVSDLLGTVDRSGTDGWFSTAGPTDYFTTSGGAFTSTDVGRFIAISSASIPGNDPGQWFRIEAIISPTQVEVDRAAGTLGPWDWDIKILSGIVFKHSGTTTNGKAFKDTQLLANLKLYSAGPVYEGEAFIGAVIDDDEVTLSPYGGINNLWPFYTPANPTLYTHEWELYVARGVQGETTYYSGGFFGSPVFDGLPRFRELTDDWDPVALAAADNTYIRRTFAITESSRAWAVGSVIGLYDFLTELRRFAPGVNESDFVCNILAGDFLTEISGRMSFEPNMCINDKVNTHDSYIIYLTSGVNSGQNLQLTDYVDSKTIGVSSSGALVPDTNVQFYVDIFKGGTPFVEETGSWEAVQEQVVLDGNSLDLSNTPTQDIAVVDYEAHGVREPTDVVVASGLAGVFTNATSKFTATNSPFVAGDVGRQIVGLSGDNINLHYLITAYIDANNVTISPAPVDDAGPVEWQLQEKFEIDQGDTLYSVGMPDHKQHRGKSRTGRDTDLREEPVRIKVT